MSSDAPRIITVKTATPEFPRHSEPAMLERQDRAPVHQSRHDGTV